MRIDHKCRNSKLVIVSTCVFVHALVLIPLDPATTSKLPCEDRMEFIAGLFLLPFSRRPCFSHLQDLLIDVLLVFVPHFSVGVHLDREIISWRPEIFPIHRIFALDWHTQLPDLWTRAHTWRTLECREPRCHVRSCWRHENLP